MMLHIKYLSRMKILKNLTICFQIFSNITHCKTDKFPNEEKYVNTLCGGPLDDVSYTYGPCSFGQSRQFLKTAF